jgi:hypothetical protein
MPKLNVAIIVTTLAVVFGVVAVGEGYSPLYKTCIRVGLVILLFCTLLGNWWRLTGKKAPDMPQSPRFFTK